MLMQQVLARSPILLKPNNQRELAKKTVHLHQYTPI